MICEYQDGLEAAGGRLFLSGVDPSLARRLHSARAEIQAFPATDVLGESTLAAYDAAATWAAAAEPEPDPAT